ncbi:MAG: Zn-ribbon containing protein, partial [Halobacteriaceae archaeon]
SPAANPRDIECPECGGTTFQYFKGEPSDVESSSEENAGVSDRVGQAARTVRGMVTDDGRSETDSSDESDDAPPTEDEAQAVARSEMVDDGELPEGRVAQEPTDERPDMEELRAELNDQFESIRIIAPGQYELNLMELYDREEYIISLQEDGKYVIEVPDAWHSEE